MKVRIPLLVIAALTFNLVNGSSSLAAGYCDEGIKQYNAGNYEKAGAYFAAALRENPNDPTAEYLLGNAFVKLNRLTEAQSAYRQAISLDRQGDVAKLGISALDGVNGRLRNNKESVRQQAAKTASATAAQQTADSASRVIAERDAQISRIEGNRDLRIRHLKMEMQEKIEGNGPAISIARNWSEPTPFYDPSSANAEIRDQYMPQINAAKDDADRQIKAVKEAYRVKLEAFGGVPREIGAKPGDGSL